MHCVNLVIYLNTRVQWLGTRSRYQKQVQRTDPRTKAIPRTEAQLPRSRLAMSTYQHKQYQQQQSNVRYIDVQYSILIPELPIQYQVYLSTYIKDIDQSNKVSELLTVLVYSIQYFRLQVLPTSLCGENYFERTKK